MEQNNRQFIMHYIGIWRHELTIFFYTYYKRKKHHSAMLVSETFPIKIFHKTNPYFFVSKLASGLPTTNISTTQELPTYIK